MKAVAPILLSTLSIVLANDCLNSRLSDVKNGRSSIRAVNLGSWFVLEEWLVPSLWSQNGCSTSDVQGQYQFEKCVGGNAASILENHWNTFITESDFVRMAQNGVNAVRVPVGWWTIYDTVGGASKAHLNYYITPTDYAVGGLKYLDRVFEWGNKYGIAVLIDMHAAPGSQNGNDNSSPPDNTHTSYWGQYQANVGETVDAIGLYTERYSNQTSFLGLFLLNEPANIDINVLQDYYVRAYNRIRQVSSTAVVIISTPISPWEAGIESHWTGFMNPPSYTNVWMDVHYYQCFGGFDQNNPDSQIAYAKYDRYGQVTEYNQKNPKPLMIGEWSGCGVPDDRAEEYIQAQVGSYMGAKGWSFWAWQYSYNVWSFKSALDYGWIYSSEMASYCSV